MCARVDPCCPDVAANLLAPLLVGIAPALREVFVGEVIASGVLVHEADAVAAAFAAAGLIEAERRVRGEWAALLLRRADGG